MQSQHLSDLKLDFKRYTYFTLPAAVRGPANEALKVLSESEVSLPITDSQHPAIVAFCAIIDNKKTNKTCSQLICIICDCLRKELIIGDALSAIIRKLETYPDINDEIALKIIQFSTSIIGSHFLDMHIFQTILSILVSLCSFQSEIVSTSSIAAIDQIISSFFTFTEKNSESLTALNKRDIDLCYSMAGGNSGTTFSSPIHKVVFLVLRDIVQICIGQNSLWLRIHHLKSNICFGVLQNIILQHFDLIVGSKIFINLISNAMDSAYSQNAPLSFCIVAIENFLSLLPKNCGSLFASFLADLKKDSPKLTNALIFYRILLLRNSSIVVNFCLKCDQNANLLSSLIAALCRLCDSITADYNQLINISLTSRNFDWLPTPEKHPMFAVASPFEITIFFVVSCYKAANSALKILVSHTWSDILLIFQVGASVVTGKCCYHLMQGLHSLVVLTNELMLDDARGSAIGAFCTILVSPKGPEADEVKRTAYLTVSSAIETTPSAFKGHWNKLMTALSEFLWRPQTLSFTKDLPLKHVVEIVQSLFTINDGNPQTRHWAMDLFADLLISHAVTNDRSSKSDPMSQVSNSINNSNSNNAVAVAGSDKFNNSNEKLNSEKLGDNKFEAIWEKVEEIFSMTMVNQDSQAEALLAFFRLLNSGFTSKSERCLCATVDKLFGGKFFDPETRDRILEQVHLLLSQNGGIVDKGWPPLLHSLLPRNFEDDVDVLNSAFRCLQLICSDLMFSLSQEEIHLHILNLTIAFAEQKADINVSLSAFGLLWNLATVAKSSTRMWRIILSKTAPLIGDPRNDVSLCAVNTFFSLIISNSQSLMDEIFQFLSSELFDAIIEILIDDRPESEATQQLAFHELAHCSRNLWGQFSVEDNEKLWRRMVAEHEKFMIRCTKREVVIISFQFYEEVFQCSEFSEEMFVFVFDSIDRLTTHFISHETSNSPLYGSFGRMIRYSMPLHRSRINMNFLKRWLKIIEALIFDLDCGDFLPPTAHKTLDALDLLFPLPNDMIFVVYESMVKIAAYKTVNNRLTEVAVEHLCDICENRVPKEILSTLFIMSKSLFKMKEARRLVLDFVANDIPINDEMVENVCDSLMNLAQSDSELTDKTASSVLKLFLRISDSTKLKFIDCYAKSYIALFELWTRYLRPNSEEFDKKTALLCTTGVVENLGAFLEEDKTDDVVISVLGFLTENQSYGECYECNLNFQHVFVILPKVAELVLRDNIEIRKLIKETILIVSQKK